MVVSSLFMRCVAGWPERMVMRRLSWHCGERKKSVFNFLSPDRVWQFFYSGCWLAAFMVSGIVMSEIISPMTSGSTAFIIKRNQVKIVILFML
ncbi:hypothetical protein TN98_06720 [Pantoea anthophila]|nr:hypothetical protein TN98_06720 [Pantoea anthophila]